MMKALSVFQFRERLLLSIESHAVSGIRLAMYYVYVPVAITDVQLGMGIRWALGFSYSGLPNDANKDSPAPHTVVGVKTWKAFENEAKCCEVEDEDGIINLTPYALARDGGFEPREKLIVTLDKDVTDIDLGKAVRQCLSKCE